MMNRPSPSQFAVISGSVIASILSRRHGEIVDLIENAYRLFAAGKAVNPSSHFLRFPGAPQNRIIALPAAIIDGAKVAGIKWVSSFPANITHDLPRASAVLILNDLATGFPYACLEGSIISSARTAASATLGAYWLRNQKRYAASLGIIGAGPIARRILEYLFHTGWEIRRINSFDLQPEYAKVLNNYAQQQGCSESRICEAYEEAVQGSDLIVFATTTSAPYIHDPGLFQHNPCILHISLRDLGVKIIQNANNIVDDVDHCLQANTSLHIAEQVLGDRSFVNGNLVELMNSGCALRSGRPSIFSPFGMGILDLALGNYVYEIACKENSLVLIDDFAMTNRWL